MNPDSREEENYLYQFGSFCLDPVRRTLTRDGERIPLPGKAFDTLLLLLQHSDHILTKDQLMKLVWPDSFVEDNNLTQHISRLRHALGGTSNGQAYIETVPRQGYRFVEPVTVLPYEEPDLPVTRRNGTHVIIRDEKEQEAAAPADIAKTRTRRRGLFGAAGVALLGAGMAIVVLAGWRTRATTGLAQPSDTVVILPFRNLHPNPDSDFLGVALVRVAREQLSYSSQVVQPPSIGLVNYRVTEPSPGVPTQEARRQVSVSGYYEKSGQTVSMWVDIVAEPGHMSLWHGTVVGGADSLMSLQDSLADQIGAALRVPVRHISPQPRVGTAVPANPAAYEYILRGAGALASGDFRKGIEWHQKAIGADPESGPALAYLAGDYVDYCYRQSAYPHAAACEPSYLEKALALYRQALDKDAASPAQLSLNGLYLMELGRLDEAVALLRHAVQLNPNWADAHLWLSQAYRYGGMLQESRSEEELASRLNPETRENTTANVYLYLGEYDKFLETMPREASDARNFFYRGLAQYYKGSLSEAEQNFRRAYEMDPAHPHARYSHALLRALAAENDDGIRELRIFEQSYQADGEMLYKAAQAYAILGDKRSAVRLLRQSIEHNFYCYPYFLRDPLLEPSRDDPEYSGVMELARLRHEAFRRKFF
jgi:DNA-binding winged helix-turn-helix (wHTH) protein/tetratricopeptide (TPR) repeat protein